MGFPKKFIHLYQPCPVPSCKISSKNIFTKWKRCSIIATAPGALAQLARVPHWQCGSHRFESDMLHQAGTKQTALSFFCGQARGRLIGVPSLSKRPNGPAICPARRPAVSQRGSPFSHGRGGDSRPGLKLASGPVFLAALRRQRHLDQNLPRFAVRFSIEIPLRPRRTQHQQQEYRQSNDIGEQQHELHVKFTLFHDIDGLPRAVWQLPLDAVAKRPVFHPVDIPALCRIQPASNFHGRFEHNRFDRPIQKIHLSSVEPIGIADQEHIPLDSHAIGAAIIGNLELSSRPIRIDAEDLLVLPDIHRPSVIRCKAVWQRAKLARKHFLSSLGN